MPLAQNRLTDRTLRNLKPAAGRAYDLADGGDLYVRVEPSGSKVFWLRYQLGGRRRRWVLGHYGETGVSLAEAREKRDDARKLLRQGIDPFELKAAASRAARPGGCPARGARNRPARHLDRGVAGRRVLCARAAGHS